MTVLRLLLAAVVALLTAPVLAQTTVSAPTAYPVVEGDAVLEGFRFRTGERMDVKIHYRTLGTPVKNDRGIITNSVLLLHGTGGTGAQFLRPQFADELFNPGQVLDINRYYIIMPDNIGHGQSSKPSDGMRMAFPRYDYQDMVAAQHKLLSDKLGITYLELLLGTSMGCMHGFMWATEYEGFAQRLAPFACLPVEIAGRNRMWRQMSIDAIKADPAWNGGNYTAQPAMGMRTATDLSILAGENPLRLQHLYPTREQAEAYLAETFNARIASANDANDTIYQLDSSRSYNPFPIISRNTVPTLWINSADDFINPPGQGGAEAALSRMPKAVYILIGASTVTRGHSTHTWAAFWKNNLAQLMSEPIEADPRMRRNRR